MWRTWSTKLYLLRVRRQILASSFLSTIVSHKDTCRKKKWHPRISRCVSNSRWIRIAVWRQGDRVIWHRSFSLTWFSAFFGVAYSAATNTKSCRQKCPPDMKIQQFKWQIAFTRIKVKSRSTILRSPLNKGSHNNLSAKCICTLSVANPHPKPTSSRRIPRLNLIPGNPSYHYDLPGYCSQRGWCTNTWCKEVPEL